MNNMHLLLLTGLGRLPGGRSLNDNYSTAPSAIRGKTKQEGRQSNDTPAGKTGMWMEQHLVKITAGDSGEDEGQNDVGLITQQEARVKKPAMYQVLLLNDDYTPMDYVVSVLKVFFDKSQGEATKLMLKVHHEGKAIVGVYTRELAETKVVLVTEDARKQGHPLQCVMEKV